MVNILSNPDWCDFTDRHDPLRRVHGRTLRMLEVLRLLDCNTDNILAPMDAPDGCRLATSSDLRRGKLFIRELRNLRNGLREFPEGVDLPAHRPWLEARFLDRKESFQNRPSKSPAVVFPNDQDDQEKLMLFAEKWQENGPNTLEILVTEIHQTGANGSSEARGLYFVNQHCSFSLWLRQCVGTCPDRQVCVRYLTRVGARSGVREVTDCARA
jgi:hypothetical protein